MNQPPPVPALGGPTAQQQSVTAPLIPYPPPNHQMECPMPPNMAYYPPPPPPPQYLQPPPYGVPAYPPYNHPGYHYPGYYPHPPAAIAVTTAQPLGMLPNPFSLPPPPIPGKALTEDATVRKDRTSYRSSTRDEEYSRRHRSSSRDDDDYRSSSRDYRLPENRDRQRRRDALDYEDYRRARHQRGEHRDSSSRSGHPDFDHRSSSSEHRSDSRSSSRRSSPSRSPPSRGRSTTPAASRPPPARRASCVDSERERLATPRDSTEANLKKHKEFLERRAEMNANEIIEQEKKVWTRSAPADLYYQRDSEKPLMMRATKKLQELCDQFEAQNIDRARLAKAQFPTYHPPKLKRLLRKCKGHSCNGAGCNDSSSDSSSDDEPQDDDLRDEAMEWLEHRQNQPFRLSKELWDNQPNEVNDGPACRCSSKAKKIGIRHGVYQGETESSQLDPSTNNSDKLFHYRITISPPTNFLIKNPTVIHHDEHEFIFEGFSLFTTEPLQDLPVCNVLRFNIKYSILYVKEKVPDNFTLRELKLFHQYFFHELLELLDWDINDRFYFMPRFVRDLSENGKEILSMNEVLKYLISSNKPLIDEMDLLPMIKMSASEWLDFADKVKGMIVTYPGMKPAALRVDQLDREQDSEDVIKYPDIVHFGTRPAQLCYAGNSEYQKAWREFVKFRHLLANMPKPSYKDKRTLENMEMKLFEMRSNSKMKRDVTVAISSQGFYKTGLYPDIVQHGMLLPVLVNHLRLHASLDHFEKRINYKFQNKNLLQLAMTHPSYKENYGTTPDHARNTLSNCGIRQPEYGDKKVHFASTRKRGINMLINIMSRFGKKSETESNVQHNERLEFLGDAVVEFITSVHLFYMFTDIEEGGLATYRAALVQNQHLAILAEVLGLEKYMLYAHGSDLCHDSELRHAMANCFEAVMGAIFLDGGINQADRVFADALFGSDQELFHTWTNLSHHPLQLQEPAGDRQWIETFPLLKKLTEFENATGIEFTHIRLLARAFTDRSLGFSNLTLGSNQRLEFLGDTVLQLVTSDYLYRHFPEHHEGHLSLLRSSIVNNRTQSVVCDDLGIAAYAAFANPKHELKTKDRADLLEAYIGALYIDKDLEYCQKFAEVCFFPRLNQFIVNQEWNDPKSKLQQCCLTLRSMNGKEPDIPVYKVTESKGPTNTRVYGVVVYFRDRRLAKAQGHSIQEAEMNAAKLALEKCSDLFPHLTYQKKIVERSFHRQSHEQEKNRWREEVLQKRKELGLDKKYEEMERAEAAVARTVKEQPAGTDPSKPSKRPRVASDSGSEDVLLESSVAVVHVPPIRKRVKRVQRSAKNEEPREEGECSEDENSEDSNVVTSTTALASIAQYEDIDSSE